MRRLPTVLVLGGTTEATALIEALAPRIGRDLDVVVSFAGRTTRPTAPAGTVRIGGFGGVDGLAEYLSSTPVDVAVDALHPFAAVMPCNAAEACRAVGVDLLRLQRPSWSTTDGDDWAPVADMSEASAEVALRSPQRVLLTIGRQELDPFRPIVGPTFLVRSIEPPDLDGAWAAVSILDRGPFHLEGERDLLARGSVDLLVTKNSGGTATAAKLTAARELGVPVVMVERPPKPPVPTVSSVDEAIAWIDERVHTAG